MELSKNFKRQLLIYFLISMLAVVLDQFTKNIILRDIGLNNSKPFLPGIIQFTVVQNTGGAFSLFKEHPTWFKLIGIFNVILFSYFALCPTVTFNFLTKAGCACILGGTLGNLIDRFIRGGVIDFLDLQLFKFAVFNLGDVFIDVGVVLILIGWLTRKTN